MILYSIDDDSDSKESDFLSVAGEDVDVYINHYRIPKLQNNYGPNRASSSNKIRGNREQVKHNMEGKIMSLTELAAQKVACYLPFGQVEHFSPPVPEPMQCRITFWSFPQDEEDIRLYTCLANGSADVFIRAEELISLNCVCDMLQVGFHLSANVRFLQEAIDDTDCFRVAITFDRRRITSCSCSCAASTFWCQHVVAVCLQRIRKSHEVTLRAPVSESLQRLEKNQLQKFAQYLINELPQQILPAAQKLLDELLSGDDATINQNPAAPDPTAGATVDEQTSWCLDDSHLSMDIQKILLKQCQAQPTVCSDIQALHITAPPAATEYSQLLRPIRGREPEGLWNLISIVGEMMKRRDCNFYLLLEIITTEVLRCEKIVTWWFETKVSLHSGSTISYSCPKNTSQNTSQNSCSNFCDEIVHLWRQAAMNPGASASERKALYKKFFDWHLDILKSHEKMDLGTNAITRSSRLCHLELFSGFKPSMEGCLMDWNDWDNKRACMIDPVSDSAKTKSTRKKKKKSKAKQISVDTTDATLASDTTIDGPTAEDAIEEQDPIEPQPGTSSQTLIVSNLAVSCSSGPSTSRKEPDDVNAELPVVDDQAENRDIERDLRVYYMEKPPEAPPKPESIEDLIKINIRRLNNPLEVLYAKAEGLYAHGHVDEARKLAVRAAEEILNHPNYPNFRRLHTLPKRRRRKASLDNQMSIVASEALSKITFLCNVLLEDPENYNLVFRLLLFGIEIKRSPATTKPLEVKLINQKHNLVTILESVVLHEEELNVLRHSAQAFQDGTYENYSDALTTLILGDYLFKALVLSKGPSSTTASDLRSSIDASRSGASSSYSQANNYQLSDDREPILAHEINPLIGFNPPDPIRVTCIPTVHGKQSSDLTLGFQAALNAVSVKVTVSEVDHPLLCEGLRRQRGDLVLSMLTHYKDDQEKLDLILKHLFDKDTSQLNCKSLTEKQQAKKGGSTQDPNQPTEASAYFTFELAKSVFDKAGGNSMTTHLFRPQVTNQNGARSIHKRLHMCSLRIALYSLGLQNSTSSNWLHRTYNSRASFILEQALEIGLPAIKFLSENWLGHLTPVETACIADKAGCSNDPETKRVAASLAKSCLKSANHLDVNAVRRILAQCKEQSIEMIEEACSDIERVAETENVCVDVLFATARAWSGLAVRPDTYIEKGCCQYKDSQTPDGDNGASDWLSTSNHQSEGRCQHFNEPVRPVHWDVYTPSHNIYSPTYKYIEYVKSAYQVGIKALDAMKPSPHMNNKYNRDDVLWLLELSKQLGREYLHNFSRSAIKNITNPHVLHHICADLIKLFDSLPEDPVGRMNILLPLIHTCLERFAKQTRDLTKNATYEQKNHIDSILDLAQELTNSAYTPMAVNYFMEILKVVDTRKPKKYRVHMVDTRERHEWVKQLSSQMARCCTLCCSATPGHIY